ncbi:HIRAN domain-containing protein [Cetobacterium sp.]|uniref:HIRAN domain-containing protein n=1 Tax=Cetobacterium sp. TaxID=2071632 RepID=UPI003F3976DD
MIETVITWKNPTLRERYEVGELIYNNEKYIFKYCCDLTKAIEVGFKGLGEFEDLTKEYIGNELFLTFSTRVPNKKRKDFQKFLEENKIPKTANDLEILMSTRGVLATDTIELFEKIDFEKNEIKSFLVGTRHYITEKTYLDENMEIEVVLESENPQDKFAVYINNQKKEKLGYIPRIYSKKVTEWLGNNKYFAKIEKLLKLDDGKRVEIYISIKK